MFSQMKNHEFQAGKDVLNVPFVVNVRELDKGQLVSLLDSMTEKLGAKYFKDQALLFEVLDDQYTAAIDPRKSLEGPFVGVFVRDGGVLRVSTFDMPHGGMAIYTPDQFQKLASDLDGVLEFETPIRQPGPRFSMAR